MNLDLYSYKQEAVLPSTGNKHKTEKNFDTKETESAKSG